MESEVFFFKNDEDIASYIQTAEEIIENLYPNSPCRDYLDYIREHRSNVSCFFDILKEKCEAYNLLSEKEKKDLELNIKNHDLSKYTRIEFYPYLLKFFYKPKTAPVSTNIVQALFSGAVNHHYASNPHHDQYWERYLQKSDSVNKRKIESNRKIYLLEKVCDMLAMGKKKEPNDALIFFLKSQSSSLTREEKKMVEKALKDCLGVE